MRRNEVVIIGAGLGGLQCAYILAKKGMKVTVLEKSHNIGGCLQTFQRNGVAFDTGFHYVGSLGEGESLNALFRYFGLMDLPWKSLDRECFDEIIIGNESFPLANGHKEFAECLIDRFPKSRKRLETYTGMLKSVGDGIFDVIDPHSQSSSSYALFGKPAYSYLRETLVNPLLIKVVSGGSLKMELQKGTLPLYTFAQINDSFIRSAWRLKGSGNLIAESLAESIVSMGGSIYTGSKVIGLKEDVNGISEVITDDGTRYQADIVISSLHPKVTVSLCNENGKMRKSYRSRIAALENTTGVFTANIRLKKDVLLYLNRNIFIHNLKGGPWKTHNPLEPDIMMHYYVPESGEYADRIDILTPMTWDEVAEWNNTPVGRRGNGYSTLKKKKYWQCMRLVERRLPQLWEAIDRTYTSSPLTWADYTGTPQGSAFGIRKDCGNPLMTVISPRTPVPNLFMTGQSLNLHGLLGVSMTSLLTCSEILGKECVWNEIEPFIKDFNDNK